MLLRMNLFTWRQVERGSVLLFRRLCFDVMVWNFVVEQGWQNFELLLYWRASSITSKDIVGVMPFFFDSSTHFDSSVNLLGFHV